MLSTRVVASLPASPAIVFTVNGPDAWNPHAAIVLDEMRAAFPQSDRLQNVRLETFPSLDAAQAALGPAVEKGSAVAVYDGRPRNFFSPVHRGRKGVAFPTWAHQALWGIVVGDKIAGGAERGRKRAANCAEQARAWFGRQYEEQVGKRQLPWGPVRKGEEGPAKITLPSDVPGILARLNDGPDMAADIAHMEHAKQLPRDARISWIRVPGEPATYPKRVMDAYLRAVGGFERACADLACEEQIAHAVMAGVRIDSALPRLRECYLMPRNANGPVIEWAVRRPDMHVNGDSLVASENDEMPGGFTDLVHVDRAYGVNAANWQQCFDWLCAEGPLVFVVSDGWSAGYIRSTKWLVDFLRSQGRDAHLVTTADLGRITVTDDAVLLDGNRVGTLWRQFPMFETTGKLAELVFAAQDGKVRMVPEFAHFGNKTWFSLFWECQDDFRARLNREDFDVLRRLIPESKLVLPDEPLPLFHIAGIHVESMDALKGLAAPERDQLVLKITGANDLAARSYGVFVAAAHNENDWRAWLDKRIARHEPFIIQRRFATSVERIAVLNIATRAPEVFRCRVLLRPWVVGNRLVSSHTCCTPEDSTKVHGRVDMAVQPVVFVD